MENQKTTENIQIDRLQEFKAWVNACQDLIRPWKVALIVTNCLWALVFAIFILLAYIMPYETDMSQDFKNEVHSYSQSYGGGSLNETDD